ncbi:MAG: glutamate synthase subunit beta [Oscillospiraceae bacterium]|jgi:glutamate synthase (NADPH/NADH) small chain|nr:glutamate synthase subunit beta [Oscillospiraceae bacterium]
MGKATGFLDYARRSNPAQEPLARIKHWKEFHPQLPEEARREQGARCMECGVPFCQSGETIGGMTSGCPLHNLVPEWNDLIYTGNLQQALLRLLKTNSFPEFTGRVCPALCEAACTCGMNGEPVTIRENELGIIESAFEQGLMQPKIPAVRSGKRVAIVGSGPAGLAAADRLNRRGHQVTVFERDDRVGGLLMYGIPNMKLEKQVIERRVQLMLVQGVEFRTGVDVGRDAQDLQSEFDAVILCCGAKQPRDLSVAGRDAAGVHFAVDFLSATTKSLLDSDLKDGNYLSAQGKDVVIVGGGDTGNDCVATAIRHGCKSVTQLEMMPQLPTERGENNRWPQWPLVCKTDYGQEEAIAVFGSDPRVYQTTVKEILKDDAGQIRAVKTVALYPEKDEKTGRINMREVAGSEQELPCGLLLLAAGFLGPQRYIAEAFGVETDARGNYAANDTDYSTNIPAVFAAGDARRGQSLVVWAIAEGAGAARAVDEYLMGYTYL